jgi:hypothetical protein
MTRRGSWVLGALIAAGGLSGCVVRSAPVGYVATEYSSGPEYAEVYVAQAPPAPVVEYPTPPPGHGYVWLQGYWDWTGYDWYWVNGYWVRQRPGYVYVAPTYNHVHGRWVYHRSHWVGRDGRRDYVYARPAPAARGRGSWRAAPAQGYPSSAPPAAAAPSGGTGSWRASPAPAAPSGGARAYPAPAAPSGGGSWRASPAPAGNGAPPPAAAAPPSSGGGWRASPAPAASPAQPPPPAATAPPSSGGGWRASPAPVRTPPPAIATPPTGIEQVPGYQRPSQGARPLPGTWSTNPTPSSPPPAAGGPHRVRPVASQPAPQTTPIQVSPPPRRATPQAQPAQGGGSNPQPVQEQPRARRGRPAAAEKSP